MGGPRAIIVPSPKSEPIPIPEKILDDINNYNYIHAYIIIELLLLLLHHNIIVLLFTEAVSTRFIA